MHASGPERGAFVCDMVIMHDRGGVTLHDIFYGFMVVGVMWPFFWSWSEDWDFSGDCHCMRAGLHTTFHIREGMKTWDFNGILLYCMRDICQAPSVR